MELDAAGRLEIVDIFGRLVETHCPRGQGAQNIGAEDGRLWDALVSGGWLDMAGSQEAGGSGLSLADLALLCVEWGRRLPPQPFATSALARRWGVAGAIASAGKFTFALPAEDGVVVPFGAADDVTSDVALPSNSATDDEFSPALPVVRGPGESKLTAEQLSEVQILMAAEAIGAAEETFERCVAYSQERVAYGSPISGFQAMRHWMADMHVDLELAKSTLFWALNVEGSERRRALKIGVDLCQKVATDAIQVYGGIGFTWDFGAHLYMRHTIAANELVHLEAA